MRVTFWMEGFEARYFFPCLDHWPVYRVMLMEILGFRSDGHKERCQEVWVEFRRCADLKIASFYGIESWKLIDSLNCTFCLVAWCVCDSRDF